MNFIKNIIFHHQIPILKLRNYSDPHSQNRCYTALLLLMHGSEWSPLYIQILYVLGIGLDEFFSGLYFISHQGRKGKIDFRGLLLVHGYS